MDELKKLSRELLTVERKITLLELENFSFIPEDLKDYMIGRAKTKRELCLNAINALRNSTAFDKWLDNRDENLLGNYQPEAGPRCQLNNEPKQP